MVSASLLVPENMEPDVLDGDETSDRLLSFDSIKNKTMETLYGSVVVAENNNKNNSNGNDDGQGRQRRLDKSPKGSVDEPIRELVDLINAHPCFATLSSCSGRITLYDKELHKHRQLPPVATTTTTKNSQEEEEEEKTEEQEQQDNGETTTTTFAPTKENDDDQERFSSGKGKGGGWLLSSHESVDPAILSPLLSLSSSTTTTTTLAEEEGESGTTTTCLSGAGPTLSLLFQMEPMLLHVAASTLERGQQLLGLALQLGFRESGLVVTKARVTVAIRSHSLALCVPLARTSSNHNHQYLTALVEESNRRLLQNHAKLHKLQDSIRTNLFRTKKPKSQVEEQPLTATTEPLSGGNNNNNNNLVVQISKLPRLNLWGHAAVVVPEPEEEEEGCTAATVYVFGGYGSGPLGGASSKQQQQQQQRRNNGRKKKNGPVCQRCDRVYTLRCTTTTNNSRRKSGRRSGGGGVVDKDWIELEQIGLTNNEPTLTTWFGMDVQPIHLSPREGLQACLLPLPATTTHHHQPPVILIWGGRSSPTHPFGDSILYQPHERRDCFWKPLDLRGEVPAPRWGHTLTPLNNNNNNQHDGALAVLIGGRNETTSLDSVHILSIVVVACQDGNEEKKKKSHFLWSRLQSTIPAQFHHAVVATTVYNNDDNDDDKGKEHLIIFGGLADPNDLMECFSDSYNFVASLGNPVGNQSLQRFCQKTIAPVSMYRLDETKKSLVQVTLTPQEWLLPHYGSAACALTDPTHGRHSSVVALNGGVPFSASRSTLRVEHTLPMEPLQWWRVVGEELQSCPVDYHDDNDDDAENLDFGVLVHHCCLALPDSSEALLLGGGVSSFAFGASFSEYGSLFVCVCVVCTMKLTR